MTTAPRVLVFDGLSETEAVLKAVLEPRGAHVERRRSSEVSASDDPPPQVVVLDLDDPPGNTCVETAWPDVPRVVLSSRPCSVEQTSAGFLEKPFHYPELVQILQRLLDLPTERRRVG